VPVAPVVILPRAAVVPLTIATAVFRVAGRGRHLLDLIVAVAIYQDVARACVHRAARRLGNPRARETHAHAAYVVRTQRSAPPAVVMFHRHRYPIDPTGERQTASVSFSVNAPLVVQRSQVSNRFAWLSEALVGADPSACGGVHHPALWLIA